MSASSVRGSGAPAAARRLALAAASAGRESADVLRGVGRLRIPELLLGAALILEDAYFGLPVPTNELAVLALILVSLLRRPTVSLGRFQVIVPILVIALAYVGVLSMFADPTEFAADWKRRLLRLSMTTVLLLVLASGRADLRSVLAGLGTALVANAALFYAGLAPDDYGGVLSGYFMDKNVAGLGYAVYGVVLLCLTDRRWARIGLFVVFGGLVWLTGSRTSISAYVAAGAWIVVSPWLPVVGRWVLGLATYLGVRLASEDYSRIGVFSDRLGSDLLRSRIDAASKVRVEQAGFFGDGLGEAYVKFAGQDRTWYFHNSYWSALVEGGWPWLLAVLGVTVLLGIRPFVDRRTRAQVGGQAALIAALICAWRLGEVFYTLPWAVALAAALQAWAITDGGEGRRPSDLGGRVR